MVGDLLGAACTLTTLAGLCLGGYLLARALLAPYAAADLLALAVATVVCATAEALGIGLLLGIAGALRFDAAFASLTACIVVLWLVARGRDAREGTPRSAGGVWRRTRRQLLAALPAALILLHGAGTEALHGLLRPPLAWDSLTYHLLFSATWLQDHALTTLFGPFPTNAWSYIPANGSVWFWWWLAPSHSELYVNLASFPHFVLLGLATGGVARELGARRYWPSASFVILLTPVILRFAPTQYVDLLLASAIVSACFFGLRWLRACAWGDAVLVGVALGIGAGAKPQGLPFALAMALGLLAAGRGQWARRAAQALAAMVACVLLGGYFYFRNLAMGIGPLGLGCTSPGLGDAGSFLPHIPLSESVLVTLLRHGHRISLGDVFLGRPGLDLGAGPQAVLLVLVPLVLPFLLGRARRRAAAVVTGQIAVHLLIWLSVPLGSAAIGQIYFFVRYLDGALALSLAGAVAIAERRGVREAWMNASVIVLCLQGLLQCRGELSGGVRIAVAMGDAALLACALSPALRAAFLRHRRAAVALGIVLSLLPAPLLARWRAADRGRAFAEDTIAHPTKAVFSAGAWSWLDHNGGGGTVAVATEPGNYFVYPAMGMRLGRRAVYVNVNRENRREVADYPACNPRVQPSAAAWVGNLEKAGVRWLHVGRKPAAQFPVEDRWARALPEQFVLRYKDETNRVYERRGGAAFAVPKLRSGSALPALLRAGNRNERSGHRAAAIEAYVRFLDQGPERAEAWFNLAVVAFDLGEMGNAREALKKARMLQPDDGEIQAFAERLNRLPPTRSMGSPLEGAETPARCEAARRAAEAGRYGDAVAALKTAAWLDESSPLPHQYLANVYYVTKRLAAAAAEQRAAVARAPRNAVLRRNLGALNHALDTVGPAEHRHE